MDTVEMPIVSSAATSVVLRPIRSPKWPNIAEPIGRATNAIANVASDASLADAGSDAGKNKLGKTTSSTFGIRRDSLHLRLRHRDHDISLLVPLLNVLEGFRDLLQRITSVDDRLELPSHGKCGDESHVRHVSDGHTALDLLSASDGGPHNTRTTSLNSIMF